MKWPFPNYAGGQCDYVVPTGKHCQQGCPGCGPPTYGADKACPCDCDGNCAASIDPGWYMGLPAGNADPKVFPVRFSQHLVSAFVLCETNSTGSRARPPPVWFSLSTHCGCHHYTVVQDPLPDAPAGQDYPDRHQSEFSVEDVLVVPTNIPPGEYGKSQHPGCTTLC